MVAAYHRLLCYTMVVIFCIPLQAVLPSMSQYVVRRQCDALNMKRNHSYSTTATPLATAELFGPATQGRTGENGAAGGVQAESRNGTPGNSSILPCDSPEVSASASLWLNWIWLACNVPNMLTALALGTMSDVFGRRPLLLWCVGTQAAGSFGMAFVLFTHQPLWVFMPFFFINGLGGGCWVFVTLVTASLSDTAADKVARSHVFSVFMGLFYACGALGPLLGGQLTKYAGELFPPSETCTYWCHGGDLQTTFLLFFATNVLLVLVAVFAFRESIQPDVLARAKSQAQGKSVCWWALEPSLQPLRTIFSRVGVSSGTFYSSVQPPSALCIATRAYSRARTAKGKDRPAAQSICNLCATGASSVQPVPPVGKRPLATAICLALLYADIAMRAHY